VTGVQTCALPIFKTPFHSNHNLFHPLEPREYSKQELCMVGSYPLDYNFLNIKANYLIGMSVPPVMTAQVAYQVYLQLFKNIGNA